MFDLHPGPSVLDPFLAVALACPHSKLLLMTHLVTPLPRPGPPRVVYGHPLTSKRLLIDTLHR